MLRVVCAPDSFKESMTASTAAVAMARGVHRVAPDAVCDLAPMADGGEGTAQALAAALGGVMVEAPCHDALGRACRAGYGYVANERLAVIEVAAACGLDRIVVAERNVATATSVGVGELIADALDRGVRRFVIGLGGSATNDAGAGMASALGARLRDAQGRDLPAGGAALARLATIDLRGLDPRLRQCRFEIACDVDNPLLGPHGASAVFGPQKGAAAPMVRQLDAALTTWADVLEAATGRAVRDLPGAGAAGGLGAGFAALVDVSMHRGVDVVASAARLADRVASVDWVFTGEGCVDGQTSHGKVPWGVARIARAAGVGVIVFGGQVTPDATALLDQGVRAIVPIGRAPATLAEALAAGPADLAAAVEMVTRLLLAR